MSDAIAPTETIAGREPEAILRPSSLAELQDIVRHRDGLTLVPRGSGTQMGLGTAPEGRFAIVEVEQALTGPIEHSAADLTAVVPAGATLGALADVLGPGDGSGEQAQFLPIDPPLADTATIGGALADLKPIEP